MESMSPIVCASTCGATTTMMSADTNGICRCDPASRSVMTYVTVLNTCACPTNSTINSSNICECDAGYLEFSSYPLICERRCPLYAHTVVTTAYVTCKCISGYVTISITPLICAIACPDAITSTATNSID